MLDSSALGNARAQRSQAGSLLVSSCCKRSEHQMITKPGQTTYLQEGTAELDGAWRVVLTLKAPRVPPHVAAHIKVQVPTLLRCQADLLTKAG